MARRHAASVVVLAAALVGPGGASAAVSESPTGSVVERAWPAPVTSSSGTASGVALPPAATSRLHEVPADVAVQMWIRPAGRTLTVIVRAPLDAMRDIEWPVRPDGSLDLARLDSSLREAATIWLAGYLAFRENGANLERATVRSVRASAPDDRSFATFTEALAHVVASGPQDRALRPESAFLDAVLTVPIASETARFSLDPGLDHLGIRTRTALHVVLPGGGERSFLFDGDPGRVDLDPGALRAALDFVASGVRHILGGLDHLLFILCLVLPFRTVRGLVPVVTAFTVAHSITLVASVLGMAPRGLWFPPLVETLIAASIVWMAVENVVRSRPGAEWGGRWKVAFGFGLVHGFGFSFALAETLQFAGRHLGVALLSFNLGVEVGQLAVVAVAVPVLSWLFRRTPERLGVAVVSVFVAHTAWHWMTARGADLLLYRPTWPEPGPQIWVVLMRWAALGLLCVLAAWGLSWAFGMWETRGAGESTSALEPHAT